MSTKISKTNVATTRTGGFPIGFRRGWTEWQKDLPSLLAWAAENSFGVIDLGNDADKIGKNVVEGFRLGSVDLPEWKGMISPDRKVREQAVEKNVAYIKTCAAFGPMNYFVVMLPEKPELPRSENFGFMVESYRQIASVLETHQAKVVIEGWPGPGALCCTPEGYEAFFKQCPSPAFGVNYDPSHLLRMGINPVRFLREFIGRVYHVHGKDTELFDEGLYRFGNSQEPTFDKGHGFGATYWRYTIPGHGSVPWVELFKLLAEAGYRGAVSVELEDENFFTNFDTEKAGLIHSRNFLQSC